jgi:polyphosphate kinase
MPRNIDRRVEVLFPITDDLLKQEIIENILQIYLKDTVKSHLLDPEGTYTKLQNITENGAAHFSSQEWFLNGRATLFQQADAPPS